MRHAKVIELSPDDHSHILLTINQLSNLAREALHQGLLSRHTHGCLTEDIEQSMNILNREW